MKIEPGRMLVADAGSLVVQITNIKLFTSKKSEVAVNAGFAELARPLVYNSYHPIVNIEKTGGKKLSYDIRGNTVLQNDFLGKNRMLEKVYEGDYLIITKVGAYGIAMASGFPGKKFPKQVFL
jgi:diaminopimelate decarboxylase